MINIFGRLVGRVDIWMSVVICMIFQEGLNCQISLDTITHSSFVNITALSFYSDQVGIVSDNDTIHFTSDRGVTWKQIAIPNAISEEVHVSVNGMDTLIVIADGKYQAVRYMHGLRDTLKLLYIDSTKTSNWYPTIATNGQNILVAGSFMDQTYNWPFLFRSEDHGRSWSHLWSFSDRYNLSAVAQRQADTFLIAQNSINNGPLEGNGYFYSQNGSFRFNSPYGLSGVRHNCFNNTCIGFKDGKVFVQRGPIIWNDAQINYTFPKLAGTNNEDVRLIMNAPDEFMYVTPDSDTANKFHISAYQFNYYWDQSGLFYYSEVIDSAFYSFTDTNASGLVPGGICRTNNNIYFTLGNKIYRIGSESIGTKLFKSNNSISISLGQDFNSGQLVIFGQRMNELYTAKVVGLDGKEYWYNELPEDGRILISHLKRGVYILQVFDSHGFVSSHKFVNP